MTTLNYNVTSPNGRAIQHVLDNTCLTRQFASGGLTLVVGSAGGRVLNIHTGFTDVMSTGESGLITLCESLAGHLVPLNLWGLFDALDSDHRLVVAQAVWMAAGYDIAAVAAS